MFSMHPSPAEITALQQRFERLLVEQCAPTLACIKPGSLFPVSGASPAHIQTLVQDWDSRFRSWGLRLRILKQCPATGNCMIYLYRPSWLAGILYQPDTVAFLQSYGYPNGALDTMLQTLSHRYGMERDMPHEIGIFLGYPLADVQGFIRHKGKNCLCCGCWKCYSDADSAQQCFDRYHACTARYRSLYNSGTSIIQLIVAA
jgi:hypothetical protein